MDDELPDWRAELRMEHGLAARPAPPRVAAAEPTAPREELSWTAELLLEAGVAPARRADPALVAMAQPVKAWSVAAGFDPQLVPADFAGYQRLLHKVQDASRDRLAAAIAREPYIHAGFRAWREAGREGRTNIVHEIFPRVSQTTGEILRFHPAPLGHGVPMAGCGAYYSEQHRRVMISTDILGYSFEDALGLVVHEQVHKLQHEMYLRTHWPSRFPLSLDERVLVVYWVREEPRYRAAAAAALGDPDRAAGDAAYRKIAREYHAYDVGDRVSATAARAASRPS